MSLQAVERQEKRFQLPPRIVRQRAQRLGQQRRWQDPASVQPRGFRPASRVESGVPRRIVSAARCDEQLSALLDVLPQQARPVARIRQACHDDQPRVLQQFPGDLVQFDVPHADQLAGVLRPAGKRRQQFAQQARLAHAVLDRVLVVLAVLVDEYDRQGGDHGHDQRPFIVGG